jgi:hypothetical protein
MILPSVFKIKNMNTEKTSYPTIIRFSSKIQVHELKKLAKKSNQSVNGYVLSLVDLARQSNISWLKKQAILDSTTTQTESK